MELVYVYGDSESESGSHGDSDPDSGVRMETKLEP